MSQIYLTFQILRISLAQDLSFKVFISLGRQLSSFDRFNRPGLDSGLFFPATNATSERSFSALRRVKSYLPSTMCQQRLNNLMLLHVHEGITDAINIASEFIGDSEHLLKTWKVSVNFLLLSLFRVVFMTKYS